MTPKGPRTILRKSVSCPSSTFLVTALYHLLAQEEDLLLAQEEHVRQMQKENLLPAQEQDKKWSPEKSKMAKQHFFSELSGDLWGVICYHHW